MPKIKKLLGQILVERGIVTEEQLAKALEIQKKERKFLGEIIVELGYITKEKLEIALIRQFGSMLGEVLLKNKLISFERLQHALKKQREINRPLGEILQGLSYLSEEELLKALAIQYKMSFVKLSDYKINNAAINKLPIDFCKKNNILPIDIEDDTLVVATATPEDIFVQENIKAITGMKLKVVIASLSDIRAKISP